MRDGELQAANIRVSGTEASPGTVRFGAASEQVTGTLGGRRFDVSLAKVKLSRVGAGEWPSRTAIRQAARAAAAVASSMADTALVVATLSGCPTR